MDSLSEKILDPENGVHNNEYWKQLGVKIKYQSVNEEGDSSENLCLLKYSRDQADLSDPMIQICRGLIVSIATDKSRPSQVRPICWPLHARTNYDDFKTCTPWNECRVTHYFDGTLVNMFHHSGEWRYSTRGMISADRAYWNSKKSFQQLFMECMSESYPDFTTTVLPLLNTDHCYSFVLQHPESRNISRITDKKAWLIQVRDRNTGKIVEPPGVLRKCQITETQKYQSYNEIENQVRELGIDSPGFMIWCTKTGRRTKLVSDDYQNASRLKGNCPDMWTNLLTAVDQNTLEKYLQYFPENQKILDTLEVLTRRFIASSNLIYTRVFIQKIYTDIPPHLRKFVHDLHRLYQKRKSEADITARAGITHKVIKGFFHSLPVVRRVVLLRNHHNYLANREHQEEPEST